MGFGFGTETSDPNFLWWTGFLGAFGLVGSIALMGGIGLIGFWGLVTIIPRPPHRWTNCQDAFRKAIRESWSWKSCERQPFVEFVAWGMVCNGRWWSPNRSQWVCEIGDLGAWGWFFVKIVELGEMGRVLSFVSYQYLQFSLTHIEIFCFSHPPLLLGKFQQMVLQSPHPAPIRRFWISRCFRRPDWSHLSSDEQRTTKSKGFLPPLWKPLWRNCNSRNHFQMMKCAVAVRRLRCIYDTLSRSSHFFALNAMGRSSHRHWRLLRIWLTRL